MAGVSEKSDISKGFQNSAEPEKITSDAIEPREPEGDAGPGYDVTCPKCGDVVRIRDFGWWRPTCRCGYVWTVRVIAEGERD